MKTHFVTDVFYLLKLTCSSIRRGKTRKSVDRRGTGIIYNQKRNNIACKSVQGIRQDGWLKITGFFTKRGMEICGNIAIR